MYLESLKQGGLSFTRCCHISILGKKASLHCLFSTSPSFILDNNPYWASCYFGLFRGASDNSHDTRFGLLWVCSSCLFLRLYYWAIYGAHEHRASKQSLEFFSLGRRSPSDKQVVVIQQATWKLPDKCKKIASANFSALQPERACSQELNPQRHSVTCPKSHSL